jgi:hypothetical protein
MEPKGSLPSSEKPANDSHPERDELIHTIASSCCKINFNIILSSYPRASKRSLSVRFPTET